MTGSGTVVIGREKKRCAAGGYFFRAEPAEAWSIASPLRKGTRVTLFQKKFEPSAPTLSGPGAARRLPRP